MSGPILEVAALVEVADVDGAGKPHVDYRRWLYQDISVFGEHEGHSGLGVDVGNLRNDQMAAISASAPIVIALICSFPSN